MTKKQIIISISTLFLTLNSYALSPNAAAGKGVYAVCNTCHNTANNPALGPPMWGVQRLYKKNTASDQEFITRMADFVKTPTQDKAVHKQALSQLGLMPAMPMPQQTLINISTYILEEKFPPPCDHWKMAAEKAEKSGDLDHAEKDRKQLKRFCN